MYEEGQIGHPAPSMRQPVNPKELQCLLGEVQETGPCYVTIHNSVNLYPLDGTIRLLLLCLGIQTTVKNGLVMNYCN